MQAEMYKIGSIGHGFLAIMGRPYIDPHEPASLLNVSRIGIQQVVSLLEPGEARSLGLDAERFETKALGMGFVSFPIADMGTPASVEDFAEITHTLFRRIDRGINTLVHCRAGIGRSGLFAAGMLLYAGMDAEQAFAHVGKMRGLRVPETLDQHNWLVTNQARIAAIARGPDDVE
jgi:protein-tyrosine phosphatase